MKNSKKINPEELLSSESEILKRIANEVIDSEVAEIISGHTSSTTGHRSGSSHSSHAAALREKITKKENK